MEGSLTVDQIFKAFATAEELSERGSLEAGKTLANDLRIAELNDMALGRYRRFRFDVLERDNFTCQYCGRSAPAVVLHLDHKHPASKGGTTDMQNCVASCEDCNLGKGARVLS